MSCPTCDHTLAPIGKLKNGQGRVFHCERCGTLVIDAEHMSRLTAYTPKLVGRCRDYAAGLAECGTPSPSYLADDWKKLGIAEAINKPGDRPS